MRNYQPIQALFLGSLFSLSFSPFNLPGLAILALAGFFHVLYKQPIKKASAIGFFFGVGMFGTGVYWVFYSIRDFGHFHPVLSAFITMLFIVYLACFTAFFAILYTQARKVTPWWLYGFLFSALWSLTEMLRAKLFGGFPWLLTGTSQIESPLGGLLPILGIFGTGFITAWLGTTLTYALKSSALPRAFILVFVTLVLLIPGLSKPIQWTTASQNSISTAIIQANLSMRDKWDDAIFLKIMQHYKNTSKQLLDTKLIVMPESAIPVLPELVRSYLDEIDLETKHHNSALLLGIFQQNDTKPDTYFNSVMSLGTARGNYHKKILVPFGEYTPGLFTKLNHLLQLPELNIAAGAPKQPLLKIGNRPIATLICFEMAFQNLLRAQLPKAEWIVSVSDNGWFGNSFAIFQQLQMAQALSRISGRYQVFANNNGLSAIIDTQGKIIKKLPLDKRAVLKSNIYPATGQTPWIYWGDTPWLAFISGIFSILFIYSFYQSLTTTIAEWKKRRYS